MKFGINASAFKYIGFYSKQNIKSTIPPSSQTSHWPALYIIICTFKVFHFSENTSLHLRYERCGFFLNFATAHWAIQFDFCCAIFAQTNVTTWQANDLRNEKKKTELKKSLNREAVGWGCSSIDTHFFWIIDTNNTFLFFCQMDWISSGPWSSFYPRSLEHFFHLPFLSFLLLTQINFA